VNGFWSGAFTDYGTAVGTLGLAAITTVVAIRESGERRELRAERDIARRQARDAEAREAAAALTAAEKEAAKKAEADRRAQAEQVQASFSVYPYDSSWVVVDEPPAKSDATLLGVMVRNRSKGPIDEVDVHWFDWQDTGKVLETDDIGPLTAGSWRVLARPRAVADRNKTAAATMIVTFTDARGVRWLRVVNGGAVQEIASRGDVARVGERKPKLGTDTLGT
jgi:hypothetical protein